MKPWQRDIMGAIGAGCIIGAAGMVNLVLGLAVAGGLLIAAALLAGGNSDGPR
jgi:hypothetical protein